MALAVTREDFTGKYDGVTPSILLPSGSVSDGLNMRKVSKTGGWKPRRGCVLANTTAAESSAAIKSLHQFKHPYNSDYHFFAQVNSKLLDSTDDPPAVGTTFGIDLGVSVGATAGFSCVVNDRFCYADGTSAPIVYAGTAPFPLAVFTYDATNTAYVDYTSQIVDNRTATYANILGGATDKFYILTHERISAVTLDLNASVNSNSVTLTVKAMRSGTWTSVSALSDGTASAGKTLAQDGTISWTASASDTLTVIGNVMGYAYELSWSGAMSGAVGCISITCTMPATTLTNKWNGAFEWINGALFYDQSAGQYIEALGKLTNESDSQYLDVSSATTDDYLYVKSVEPVCGIGFGVVNGYGNTADAQIDLIEHWSGSAWTTCGTLSDTTLDGGSDSSFAQTGRIFFEASALTPVKRTFQSDKVPGYWYRISWDAALSANTRIYACLYATQPEALPAYTGCVEFKGRLFVWGDPRYKNRLRFSSYGRYDCFSGKDSGYTDIFGGDDTILCAKKFYNELVVFKKTSIYLLEGYSPTTFGILKLADTIGIASPQTAQTIEIGYPSMHADEGVNIVIWQDTDGVYVLDGRKPKKISAAIDHFFNPEKSTCIAAASIESLQAYPDYINNEYHLLLPESELVFNYITDEWYPPWERQIDLTCGIALRGTDNRYYTYGGTASGFVCKLETDTTDKTTANADQTIIHKIKTRGIQALVADDGGKLYFSPTMRFALNGAKLLCKAQSSGSVTVKAYYDMATSATTLTSSASIVNSGKGLAAPSIAVSVTDLICVEFEFYMATADVEMEVWTLHYGTEVQGRMN